MTFVTFNSMLSIELRYYYYYHWWIQVRGSPLVLDQTEAQGAKKVFFLDWPPLISGS